MSLHDIAETCSGLAIALAFVVGVPRLPLVRAAAKRRRDVRQARADWNGRAPDIRNGVVIDPGKPSMVALVTTLAAQGDALTAQMKYVVEQLSHNGGSSVKDDARKAALGAKEAIDAVDALRAETREAAEKLREETRAAAKQVRDDLLEHTAASDKTHRELFVAVQKSGPVPQPRQPADESQSSAD